METGMACDKSKHLQVPAMGQAQCGAFIPDPLRTSHTNHFSFSASLWDRQTDTTSHLQIRKSLLRQGNSLPKVSQLVCTEVRIQIWPTANVSEPGLLGFCALREPGVQVQHFIPCLNFTPSLGSRVLLCKKGLKCRGCEDLRRMTMGALCEQCGGGGSYDWCPSPVVSWVEPLLRLLCK